MSTPWAVPSARVRDSPPWRWRRREPSRSRRWRSRDSPWLADLLGGRPQLGPNALATGETVVAALGDIDVDAAMPVVGAVDAYVIGGVLRDQLAASPQQPLRLPTPADPRLAAVCALVHADPADTRTLAALGAATGAGGRTLSRLFRSEFGMAFPQWRTQSRLYHALRMLADGLPVTTVAHRCGYASASAFIDVFRRSFGYTPGTHNRRDRTGGTTVRTVQ
ncbi:helix-turn-helix transcriptional regulator [Streptomyces flaveolus]|uniref:helix-turn-helix transcriptional regulator n=1 Tax=Streptomyces flaveolus TaxID=67297 RepID=UPI0037015A61